MAEEHAEIQMIQCALASTAECQRTTNANERRIDIELPLLNVALVEVHRELTRVRNGPKDMVTKNKCLKKQEKYAQG